MSSKRRRPPAPDQPKYDPPEGMSKDDKSGWRKNERKLRNRAVSEQKEGCFGHLLFLAEVVVVVGWLRVEHF